MIICPSLSRGVEELELLGDMVVFFKRSTASLLMIMYQFQFVCNDFVAFAF